MNNTFLNFNLLNSQSLSEVKNYTSIETKLRNNNSDKFFDFFSLDDLKYANEWGHANFGYSLNEYGFRCNKIPESVDIAAFGCSFTFGLGLPENMLWHDIIGKNLNQTVCNFGVAGASVKTIIDLFLIVSKHISIKKAIFLLPSMHRMQIAKTDPLSTGDVKYLSIIPGVKSELANFFGVDYDGIFKHIPDEEIYKINKEQIYVADLISNLRNVEVYYSSWDPHTYEFLEKLNLQYSKLLPVWYTPIDLVGDVGRDKSHPGQKHHSFFANNIVNILK